MDDFYYSERQQRSALRDVIVLNNCRLYKQKCQIDLHKSAREKKIVETTNLWRPLNFSLNVLKHKRNADKQTDSQEERHGFKSISLSTLGPRRRSQSIHRWIDGWARGVSL